VSVHSICVRASMTYILLKRETTYSGFSGVIGSSSATFCHPTTNQGCYELVAGYETVVGHLHVDLSV